MLKITANNAWLDDIRNNHLNSMKNTAEKELNPKRYKLSEEARKRLYWLWVLYKEPNVNVTRAAKKIGISRQWLSPLKTLFEKSGKDPRVLEPKSKAPHNTSDRKRISKETEQRILQIRHDSRNVWGKIKIAKALKRDYGIIVNYNTVNRYLHKHKKIDPKISLKNTSGKTSKSNNNAMSFN